MAKSKALVMKKMQARVSTAGEFLKEGMADAEDPIKVLLADIDNKEKALVAGVTEAIRRGNYKAGLKKAEARDSWKKSADKASAHYQESAETMVEHAMEDYDELMKVIQAGKDAIKNMPKATRTQRIARSKKYLDTVGPLFDKLYGRSA